MLEDQMFSRPPERRIYLVRIRRTVEEEAEEEVEAESEDQAENLAYDRAFWQLTDELDVKFIVEDLGPVKLKPDPRQPGLPFGE